MKKYRITAYWYLLLGLVIAAGVFRFSIGKTGARYVTVAGWQMQIVESDLEIKSNFLRSGGQTVLMDALDPADTRELTVSLESVHGNQFVAPKLEILEYGEYLKIDYPESVSLSEGVTQVFTLSMMPTKLAVDVRENEITVKFRLYLDGTDIGSIFHVTLLPVEAPQATEPTVDATSPTDETTTPTEDTTTPEEDATTPTEDPTIPEEDPTTPTEETTPPTEETTVSPEPAVVSEDENPNTDNQTTAPETDEGSENSGETGDTSIQELEKLNLTDYIRFMKNFAADELLAFSGTFPEETTSFQLKLLDTSANPIPFPSMTRYSPDGGSSYYLLADGGAIPLEAGEDGSFTVLLDLSQVAFLDYTTGDLLGIQAVAEAEGQWAGTLDCHVSPTVQLPSSVDTQAAVITGSTPYKVQLPWPWEGCSLSYEIQRQGENTAEESEQPTIVEEENKLPIITVDEESGVLTVSAEEMKPQAGTYLLTLTWTYEDILITRREIVLFVNYTVYVQPEQAAGTYAAYAVWTQGGNEQ